MVNLTMVKYAITMVRIMLLHRGMVGETMVDPCFFPRLRSQKNLMFYLTCTLILLGNNKITGKKLKKQQYFRSSKTHMKTMLSPLSISHSNVRYCPFHSNSKLTNLMAETQAAINFLLLLKAFLSRPRFNNSPHPKKLTSGGLKSNDLLRVV